MIADSNSPTRILYTLTDTDGSGASTGQVRSGFISIYDPDTMAANILFATEPEDGYPSVAIVMRKENVPWASTIGIPGTWTGAQ